MRKGKNGGDGNGGSAYPIFGGGGGGAVFSACFGGSGIAATPQLDDMHSVLQIGPFKVQWDGNEMVYRAVPDPLAPKQGGPDFTSAIRGWRVWTLDRESPTLQSINRNAVWAKRAATEAKCTAYGQEEPVHDTPDSRCTCGTWSYTRLLQLWRSGYPEEREAVWGEVWNWGRIVKHELGYRAQFAYPKRIVWPIMVGTALEVLYYKTGRLAREYGVDVYVGEWGEAKEAILRMEPHRMYAPSNPVWSSAGDKVEMVQVTAGTEESWQRAENDIMDRHTVKVWDGKTGRPMELAWQDVADRQSGWYMQHRAVLRPEIGVGDKVLIYGVRAAKYDGGKLAIVRAVDLMTGGVKAEYGGGAGGMVMHYAFNLNEIVWDKGAGLWMVDERKAVIWTRNQRPAVPTLMNLALQAQEKAKFDVLNPKAPYYGGVRRSAMLPMPMPWEDETI